MSNKRQSTIEIRVILSENDPSKNAIKHNLIQEDKLLDTQTQTLILPSSVDNESVTSTDDLRIFLQTVTSAYLNTVLNRLLIFQLYFIQLPP